MPGLLVAGAGNMLSFCFRKNPESRSGSIQLAGALKFATSSRSAPQIARDRRKGATMSDHLVRILSKDGALRAVAADTSQLTRAICRLQGTDPTATVALGRLVSGAAVLGALLKGKQRLALKIEGNG